MSAARRVEEDEAEAETAPTAPAERHHHPVTRLALGIAGSVLLVVGVALLVLPGPGMLLVLAGLLLLSRAVPAVARFEEPVRARAIQGVEASVASPWRIAGSVLAGLGLLAAGVVWGTKAISWLPFNGWSTGSSLILSGLILLGLLAWSYRRVHGGANGDAS
jgi:hypothetical protein